MNDKQIEDKICLTYNFKDVSLLKFGFMNIFSLNITLVSISLGAQLKIMTENVN